MLPTRFACCWLAVLATSLGALGQGTTAYTATDEAALTVLTRHWEQYWNTHDIDAMGTLLSPDVDVVNVAGVWLRGKGATVNDHKQKHQGIVFRNSVWTTEHVAIRYVKPDLAILHINWGLKGDNDPDGTPRPPRHGIFTWVAIKQERQWRLLAVHNVNRREPAAPTR